METITCNVSLELARKYGHRAFTMAIGRACKDIGVFVVGAHGRRLAYIHGEPVRLSMEAHRVLGALEMGIMPGANGYAFPLTIDGRAETYSRVFGASFDDVNDIGD